MFDAKSDFALNKMDHEAIVCKSVTGVHIRLTCEDFESKEQFDHWKKWSDGDYYDTEATGRDFYDNCLSFSEAANTMDISAEDAFFAPLLQTEREDQQIILLQQIKSVLTETQYRRLWMLCVEGKSVNRIAELEGVSFQAVYISLARAKKAIVNIL